MISRFLDGQLSVEEAAALRGHLAECAACQHELHEHMQLEALGMALAEDRSQQDPVSSPTAPSRGKVLSLAERRRISRPLVIGLSVAALAAAVLLFVSWRSKGESESRVAAVVALPKELRPERAIEGRLSYAGADHYRSYQVDRAARQGSVEAIPLSVLASMDQRGDVHGVAAAYMLMGNYKQAGEYLDRAQTTSARADDVKSDRALLALLSGDPKTALKILDEVLARNPRHPQALWNQALALRALELPLMAAQAFAAVAELDERGWHEEARDSAAALRARVAERKTEWKRAHDSVRAMKGMEGQLPSTDVIRAQPGIIRLHFYDAVRTAPGRDALDALRPIATALGEQHQDTALLAYLERVGRMNPAIRSRWARAYAEMMAAPTPDVARALIAELRQAKRDEVTDILMGAMLQTGTQENTVADDLLAEFGELAAQASDPWLELVALDTRVFSLLRHGDYTQAESLLRGALSTCEASPLEYLCARLDSRMGTMYLGLHRISDALRHIDSGWTRARRTSDWDAELMLLRWLAEIEYRQDDTGTDSMALPQAYLGEQALRDALMLDGESALRDAPRLRKQLCQRQLLRHELMALMFIVRNRLDEARDEVLRGAALVASQGCTEPAFNLHRAHMLAHVSSRGNDAEIAAVRDRLARYRDAEERTPGELAFLDFLEGRLLIDRDHGAARVLLRQAITRADEQPSTDVMAKKARAYSFSSLIQLAGVQGEYGQALAYMGEEIGVAVAERCVVGIAGHWDMLVVGRGPDGAIVAERWTRGSSWMPAEDVIPAKIRAALTGCDVIDVLARSPYYGAARLLPSQLAWRFRSRRGAVTTPARQPRRVVVTNVEPPTSLGLPALKSHEVHGEAFVIRGAAATPSRVLDELADATEIEIHAHGLVDTEVSDTSFLALSPDRSGHYRLTADDIRSRHLPGAPLVILGACQAAQTAKYAHAPGSLASAFMDAGAGAVIASPAPISDADAGAILDALRQQIASDQAAAVVLRDQRLRLASTSQQHWIEQVLLFE
jgi:cellulose synthase operon protein C